MKAKMMIAKPTYSKSAVGTKPSKENLEGIFMDMLKDIYWAEKHLIKALGKMAKASYNEELRDAFESHLDETQTQIERIERCFDILNNKPLAKRCEAMEGLVKEGTEVIADYDEGHTRDAGLIASAQKVEHYEISAYGTLCAMATVLGKTKCADLLQKTKEEEAECDMKLSELAEKINQLAMGMEMEDAS